MTDNRPVDHGEDAEAGKRNPDADGSDEATKTQDLAKAGRTDFDPNAGQE